MLSPRTQRLRLVWVFLPPFLILATPTPAHIAGGLLLAAPGLILRVLASGYIDKDRALAVHGPYARLRHPLYVGSFLAGLGLVVAAARPVLLPAYLILFPLIYRPAIRAEELDMERRFGETWRTYRRSVPAFLPRPGGRMPAMTAGPGAPRTRPGSPEPTGPTCFQAEAFRRNRPFDGVLGVLIGFLVLWLRMRLFP